jgi:acetoin utilization protein AcuB
MSTTEPTVAQFMTHTPASADAGLRLMDAQERMFMDNIRHLVVQSDGRMVGVLSSRDVALALAGPDGKAATVRDAMRPHPYICAPTTPISAVAHEMEAHRYGCTVVVDNDEVVGMFTTTDALRALRQLASGKPAEPAVHPDHLPPTEPAHARPFRLRRHRPIDAGGGAVFATMPKS